MKKYVSQDEALAKLQRYCAYQDRCHQEVIKKLLDLGVYGESQDEIIMNLIQENFLNEERFAKSFARGKFRMKKWGRNKIKQELKQRQISKYCIKKGLEEIEKDEYCHVLEQLIVRKFKEYKAPNFYQLKLKVARFVITKGFESQMAWAIINSEEIRRTFDK